MLIQEFLLTIVLKPPQDFSLDDDPVMPKKSTADSCDTEFLKLVATLPESSEHNDVDKAIEKAKNPAVGSELASAGKSADTKSPGPMYSSPIVAIVRNSKRPATNRKRQPEGESRNVSCGILIETVQISIATCRSVVEPRKD